MPLTRLTMPSSLKDTRGSCLIMGTRSSTSPPPTGRAPRRRILSSRPDAAASSRSAILRSRGRVTVRQVSMEGSAWSLVMPLRVMDRGCQQGRKNSSRGGRHSMSGSSKRSCLRRHHE
jgi:hypothetical protein